MFNGYSGGVGEYSVTHQVRDQIKIGFGYFSNSFLTVDDKKVHQFRQATTYDSGDFDKRNFSVTHY